MFLIMKKLPMLKDKRFKDDKEMDSTFIQEQVIDWIEEKPGLRMETTNF